MTPTYRYFQVSEKKHRKLNVSYAFLYRRGLCYRAVNAILGRNQLSSGANCWLCKYRGCMNVRRI